MGDLRGSPRVAPPFAFHVNLGLPSLAEERLSFLLLLAFYQWHLRAAIHYPGGMVADVRFQGVGTMGLGC